MAQPSKSVLSDFRGHAPKKDESEKYKNKFLGGLFHRKSKHRSPASAASIAAQSAKIVESLAQLSEASLLPEESPSRKFLNQEDRTVKLLEYCQAKKANQLDAIFAKAAQHIADRQEEDEEKSQLIDKLVPFPPDLPVVYKVLISRLENDKSFDRFIPFCLRRLNELGNASKFLDHVSARVHARDQLVEHVCASSAVVLTDAIRDFVDINERADQLRTSIVTIDDRNAYEAELKNIKFAGKATKISSNILQNVAVLMERISALRPTLKHFQDAHPDAEAGEPVKALRKLYKAEATSIHLPPQLTFVKWLVEAIPDMRYRLVGAALQGVTRTLENLRSQNSQVGFATFRNVCQTRRIFIFPYYVKDGKVSDDSAVGTDVNSILQSMNLRPLFHFRNVLRNLIEDEERKQESGYLFDCYLTYMTERQRQVFSKLQNVQNLKNVGHVRVFLQNIVGVFALELYISYAIPGISSELYYEEMWKEASQVAVESLEGSIHVVQDESSYRESRDMLLLFVETLKMLRCDPMNILATVKQFGLHYADALQTATASRIEQVLNTDTLKALVITSDEEKDHLIDILNYWWEEPLSDYPKTLPFSSMVPKIIELLKDYVAGLANVWRDVHLDSGEALDRTVILTKSFLEKDVRLLFSKRLLVMGMQVEEYAQFHSNCSYFEEAMPVLENHICDQIRIPREAFRLDSNHIFSLVRAEAELQMFKNISTDIEANVKSFYFDTLSKQNTASSEAQKIIQNFYHCMDVVAPLPEHIIQKTWAITNTVISSALQQFLVHEVKVVTIECLHQLKVDIEQFELALQKYGQLATNPSQPTNAFTLLRQLIDLISNDDWVAYFADHGRVGTQYDRVTPEMAVRLLVKIEDPEEKGSNLFVNLTNDREKKKK